MTHYRLQIKSQNRLLVRIDDFSFVPNEITVLFGESGIGKTLISQAIFGLVDPFDLQITINRQNYARYVRSRQVKALQKNGFFVFQEPSTHLNPLLTLREQLNEGSLRQARNEQAILEALWQQPFASHIAPLLKVYPKPFRPSGGEKQRILLAMAFKKMQLPSDASRRLFVFDEPTGSLDNRYRNIFLRELLTAYTANPMTVLLITHDYSMISEFEERHSSLLAHIHFKELRRVKGAQVELFDFKAQNYTNWLKAQRPHLTRKARHAKPIVLKVESPFGVYGKSFYFTREGQTNEPVPLTIRKEELVYLKAPSGLGKTTLAKIIAGLQRPEKIRFELSGISFDETSEQKRWRKEIWGKKLGMVFQHADEALNLQAKVKDIFKGLPGLNGADASFILNGLQEMFDLAIDEQFLNQKVAYLSGGQKQRLNLLRAFLLHPDLIILDEPLNGLDFDSIHKVIDIIRRKMAAGSGILLISHNEEIFDRIVPRESRYYLHEK